MQPWESDDRFSCKKNASVKKIIKQKTKQFAFGMGVASIVYLFLLRSIVKDTWNNQSKTEI